MIEILIASASANTGSKVVEQLSESGQANVRALVRNPDSEAAKALAKLPHVTVVKGDFEQPETLKAALHGVKRAMLVSAAGDDQQYDREVAFIAAATAAHLEAVVRISTANALISLEAKGVYARAHARIEQYIEQHKAKVIDVQPSWFMSNLLWQAGEARATGGKISYPVTAEQFTGGPPFATIDPRDIARACTAILLAPKDKLDELLAAGRVEVHGPEAITFAQYFDAIGKAAGQPLTMNHISPEAYVALLVGFGSSAVMAESFKDTILTVAGAITPPRPLITKSSDALLAIWQPKYTIADWAKENAAAFVAPAK